MLTARHLKFARTLRALFNSKPRSPLPPVPLSTAKFPVIDPSQLIEEERDPWYDPKDYYPVRIGDVFRSQYQVVGKLGYGGYSTAWLCRDLMEHGYVAVKVCSQNPISIKRELAALEHLTNLPKTKHPGRECIRTSLDQFELTTTDLSSRFQCFVFEPMSESVWEFRQRMPMLQVHEPLVKGILGYVLRALDYLHTEAKVVHADIQENNILFSLNDTAPLQAYEDTERSCPIARKVVDDRTIYLSRNIDPEWAYGRPLLCDFGEARLGRTTYTGPIQPKQYRAPEVILGMPWDEKVDIWSVGVMIWDMFEGKNMFKVSGGPDNEEHYRHHLAHMVSLLGPPPVDFLQRSETGKPWEYFDAQGNWIGKADLPDDSLELSEGRLQGENKAQFLRFIRKMLKWKPEDRFSARELLEDPWTQL